MAINKDEVAASMARIKALQAMLSGGGAVEEEEEDYDPNDPNQQYEETEADAKWREEQEAEWERQQAAEREAAEKEKAEAAGGTSASAGAAATPASSSSSSTSAASSAASASAVGAIGPHQWTTAQLVAWLAEVQTEVKKRGVIFEEKGWTKEELSKWNGELDAIFASATSKAESAKLTGAQAAAWDIASDKDWGQHLAVENQYIRSAIWASWKQALRKWQDAQKK